MYSLLWTDYVENDVPVSVFRVRNPLNFHRSRVPSGHVTLVSAREIQFLGVGGKGVPLEPSIPWPSFHDRGTVER